MLNWSFQCCLKLPGTGSVSDRAACIIVMIRSPASITYANTLFEGESWYWNVILLMALQAKVSTKTCPLLTLCHFSGDEKFGPPELASL